MVERIPVNLVEMLRITTSASGGKGNDPLKSSNAASLKDSFDIWTPGQTHRFEKGQLARAIGSTFERRQTAVREELPLALTGEFPEDPGKLTQWTAFGSGSARVPCQNFPPRRGPCGRRSRGTVPSGGEGQGVRHGSTVDLHEFLRHAIDPVDSEASVFQELLSFGVGQRTPQY